MVRPEARMGADDLGPVIDRTGRVEGHVVIASSRGVRGRPSISEISSTPAPLGPGIYYDSGAPGSSTQPPPIPFRTRPPTTLHHPYTPILYDHYGYSQPPLTSYDPYAHTPSLPLRMPDHDRPQDFGTSGDSGRTRSEEAVRVGSLRIHGSEDDEDKPEDNGGDDDDDGDGDGEPVPVAHASLSGHRHAPGKGKGLTSSFMS
ncbi:hypothetical protein M9H77_28333 [Catharanthus roseus]|uniref:Uncharacterized protein n=1 Tax=Catharanthus roseus TaxID=4058 RepID=A0ACC0AGY8_CATRO|nr:hypothetical protein M9H77_28333 [Catharanthus roseus]